ncbi:MAG TPA: porin [Flavobacteriales bacterium]|nr:porin [Flavobacteriales bacterium]HMR26790.1 porin [Flavobacteriales bacterium]
MFAGSQAQQGEPTGVDTSRVNTSGKKPWYTSFTIRGYGQVRYNRLLETNEKFTCEQCDRSIGEGGGLFIRRARVIIQGQVHPRIFIYLQPDLASSSGTTQNLAQMRDWYMDIGLDGRNEFRVRLGQSKVPFSFENLQSSQNRLPLDRADPTDSAHANERDIGAFLYWAPARIRERFRSLVSDGLKGSGDYGVVGIGVYNGQTANRAEANDDLHVVARATWPFEIAGQIVEPFISGYTGTYVVTSDQRSAGVKGRTDWSYEDSRLLGGFCLYPRPFGILAEYNIGRGPEFDPVTDSISTKDLAGGFATATYRFNIGKHLFFPFVRYQVYEGGKKHERDARSYSVNDVEFGVEWQPFRNFELLCEYYIGDRRYEDLAEQDNKQRGQFLRLQAQFNF